MTATRSGHQDRLLSDEQNTQQKQIIDALLQNQENAPNNSNSKGMLVTSALLTALSVPAGYFYKNFSEQCVQDGFCSKPVSFIPGQSGETVALEISGGGGFSASAMALGILAAPAIYQTFKNMTPFNRIAFLLYCTFYVAIQETHQELTTLGGIEKGTSDTDIQLSLILPALAIISPALYNASITFPPVKSFILALHAKLYNEPEEIVRERQEFKKFKKDIEARWNQIASQAKQLKNQINVEHDKIMFLLSQPPTPLSEHLCRQINRRVGQAVGLICGGTLVANSTWNTFVQLGKRMPLGAQIFCTAVLGLFASPSNIKLPFEFFGTLFSAGPINSLALQFYPTWTILVSGLATLSQYASYSAVAMIFSKLLETTSGFHEGLLILASAGIISYHSAAIIKLIMSNIDRFKIDVNEKYFFQLEKIVNNLLSTTFEQYQEAKVELLSAVPEPAQLNLQTTVEIKPSEDTPDASRADSAAEESDAEEEHDDAEAPMLSAGQTNSESSIDTANVATQEEPPKKKWYLTWCCCFAERKKPSFDTATNTPVKLGENNFIR